MLQEKLSGFTQEIRSWMGLFRKVTGFTQGPEMESKYKLDQGIKDKVEIWRIILNV